MYCTKKTWGRGGGGGGGGGGVTPDSMVTTATVVGQFKPIKVNLGGVVCVVED